MSQRDFCRYLRIAIGSSNELESHLLTLAAVSALDVRSTQDLISELCEVRQMLFALRSRIARDLNRSQPGHPS